VPVDSQQFKAALSHWASGVSIVTARDADGTPVGLTATAFASLSLQPPLILFCLGLDSTHRDALLAAPGFAVHLLTQGQAALSARFAVKGGDKFSGLAWREGRWGAPVLESCLAVLECRMHAQLPGGDHTIVVGEVEDVALSDDNPLLYFRGGYRRMQDDVG
jgi:flavin reductase (DIM6/NTAB) family NADH-FMN oxidoreductase RutF